MPDPDVRVTFDDGNARVNVLTPGIVAEVRNYDLTGPNGDPATLWADERGRRCLRYFVSKERDENTPDAVARNLQRFADDLTTHAGIEVSFEADPSPDGLHVLTINNVDYYFQADTECYDGWGKRMSE